MGGDAHPDERRAVAKVFENLEGAVQCGDDGMGREEEWIDRLRTERRPGVWHSGGLKSEGVGARD